jgi:hypothetical protein
MKYECYLPVDCVLIQLDDNIYVIICLCENISVIIWLHYNMSLFAWMRHELSSSPVAVSGG